MQQQVQWQFHGISINEEKLPLRQLFSFGTPVKMLRVIFPKAYHKFLK